MAEPSAVVDKLTATLKSRFGEFNLVGAHSPPIRPIGFDEDDELVSRIRQLKPHIVWVGLSTSKQELWFLLIHMYKIGSGVGIGVGAAFIYCRVRLYKHRAGFSVRD